MRINIAQAQKRGATPWQMGRNRGGQSTKIHAAVDALGNSTGFHLTPEQTHDLESANALLPGTPAATVVADSAFDS